MDMLVCGSAGAQTHTDREKRPSKMPANASTGRNDAKMTADSSFHGNLKQ